jgi:uncharacterized protein YdeI (YjbR/CyaY-like superfamily)
MNQAPLFSPKNRQDWRSWLASNHGVVTGVWLVWHKKHTGKTELSYDDMVEEALCFGWIDSVPRKVDDERTSLYFSPRKPKSEWSKIYKERIDLLESKGLLQPAGMAAITVAKANGSWDRLNDSDALIIPQDLQAQFDANPAAQLNFAAFPQSARKAILAWINAAKTEATRTKRITLTAELAEQNIRANQWRPKT